MSAAWVTALLNGIMAAIWLVYLDLFYRQFRSSQQIRVFIEQQSGYTLASTCTVINLSQRPVSISSLQICLNLGEKQRIVEVTSAELPTQAERALTHGPIRAGQMIELGCFRDLVTAAAQPGAAAAEAERVADQALPRLHGLAIRLVLMHGSSRHPMAVRRRFGVERRGDGWGVFPQEDTRRWTGRRGRQRAREWIGVDIDRRGLVAE